MTIPTTIPTGGHPADREFTELQKAVLALLGGFASDILNVANGGTGLASYAAGDLLYATAATVLAKLAKQTNGQILTLASGLPAWAGDTSWTAPTLLNNWANFGAGWQPAGYLKDADGFVHLRGVITNAVGTLAGTNMFVLAAGYRPANTTPLSVLNMNGTGTIRLDVDSAGNVFPNAAVAAGALYAINGLCFDTR